MAAVGGAQLTARTRMGDRAAVILFL